MEIRNKLARVRVAWAGFAILSSAMVMAVPADSPSDRSATTSPPASTQPLLAVELPGQEPVPTAGTGSNPPGPGSHFDRAEAAKPPELPPRPQTVQDLAEKFNASRDQALKQRDADRKRILERLRSATGQERSRLISEFREKQQLWLDEQKTLAEEFRRRIQSVREEFKNRERDQLLDEVKGKAQELRERLGKD